MTYPKSYIQDTGSLPQFFPQVSQEFHFLSLLMGSVPLYQLQIHTDNHEPKQNQERVLKSVKKNVKAKISWTKV